MRIEHNIALNFVGGVWLIAMLKSSTELLWLNGAPSTITLLFDVVAMGVVVFIALSVFISQKRQQAELQSNISDAPKRALMLTLALVLALAGDIVNLNLSAQFYRYGELIKHDYLADSVWFFAPSYMLISLLAASVLRQLSCSIALLFGAAVISAALGLASFLTMMLPESGRYILIMTGGYAMIVAIPAAFGLLLLLRCYQLRLALPYWLVAGGLVLATVADALIGQFWLFGNNGAGYFPIIRQLNWLVYFSSQCLLLQLALLPSQHHDFIKLTKQAQPT
ncbi:hypothetical protein ACFOEE_09660 [Pseudoalteromonas fenneropenaei]|uniref:DUF998 domain-containing protein n=1 Tax=Pseudoalteromonas fenneropenaei TaxID=1737459 RepID=A0ABV7CJU5_9GAMM